MFTLNGCHNAEIAGFRFFPEGLVAGSSCIDIAPTTASYGTWIHDNFFYNIEDWLAVGAGTGTNIHMGGTGDAQYTYINGKCFFLSWWRTTRFLRLWDRLRGRRQHVHVLMATFSLWVLTYPQCILLC